MSAPVTPYKLNSSHGQAHAQRPLPQKPSERGLQPQNSSGNSTPMRPPVTKVV